MPEDRPNVNARRRDDDPLERALAGLKPAGGVDVPGLMYRAGQGSRDRAVAWWRGACLAAGAGLIGTWGWVFTTSERPAVPPQAPAVAAKPLPETDANLEAIGRAVVGGPRYTPVPEPAPVPEPPALPALVPAEPPDPAAEYLRIRDAVLERGLAGLPPAPPPPAPVSVAEFERTLGVPAGVFAAPYRTPRSAPSTERPGK